MNIKVIASGSSGNCYRVGDGKTSLLLECGIPIAKIKEGCDFKLSEISGCLVSHEHGDHSKSVNDVMKSGIDTYMTVGTARVLKVDGYRLHAWEQDGHTDKTGNIAYNHGKIINSFEVCPFSVHHDAAEPVGYSIDSMVTHERLIFITDTYYTDYLFQGVTHFMVEANYSQEALDEAVADGTTPEELKSRLYRSHMSIETTIDLLKANNQQHTIKQIYLIHLSNRNSDSKTFKEKVQAATGAEVYIA